MKIHREGIFTRWIFDSVNRMNFLICLFQKSVDKAEGLCYYDSVAAEGSRKVNLDK